MNLKPCPSPSCGGTNLSTNFSYCTNHSVHQVVCVNCGLCGPQRKTAGEANEAWNALPRRLVLNPMSKPLTDDRDSGIEVADLIPLAIEACKFNRGNGPGDEHQYWNEKIRKLEVRLKEVTNE